MIRSYRDLLVWQRAMDIVVSVYTLTKTFPQSEIYSLTTQIQRAAVSIPSNIAEGYGRNVFSQKVNKTNHQQPAANHQPQK